MKINPDKLQSDCFEFRLKGIPCIVCVTNYSPEIPAKLNGHPDTWDAPDPGELEFELYDRKGYRAEWLEDKVDDTILFSIEEAYDKHRRSYG